MSRLMADQEGRGDNGDSCSVEEDSVMWVNLAEGYEAVNDEIDWVPVSFVELCWLDAFLYKNACAGH